MSNIDNIIKNAPKKAKRKMIDFEVERIYGAEPKWENVTSAEEGFQRKVTNALNWANASLDHSEYKEEVIKYAQNKGMPINRLELLADWKFVNAGKLAWLVNNGCPLTENWLLRLKTNLELLIKDAGEDSSVDVLDDGTVVVAEPKISLFQRRNHFVSKRILENYLDVEELIDSAVISGTDVDSSVIYKSFTGKKVDEKIAKQVYEKVKIKFESLNKELANLEKLSPESKLVQFDNEETFAGYASDIQHNLNQVTDALNQLGAYLGNKKAIKKSEKKFGSKIKAKRIENQVSNVNFKLQDNQYKIASINPVAIIGAMTLLTFNTQTRKMSVYVANSEEGLNIKGTTLSNFNEEKSFQKIIKRPESLKSYQEGNIRRVEVMLNDIKAKAAQVNGRLNEHTILLKVFKETYGNM